MAPKILVFIFILITTNLTSVLAIQPYIIGGSETRPGELPFMVSLQSSEGHFCGGSLIKKNWILTAGHCAKGETLKSIKKIMIGLHNLNDPTNAEVFKPKKIVIHPDYDGLVSYDYALIELDGHSTKTPISLLQKPLNIASAPLNTLVTAAGWGLTRESNIEPAMTLRKVTMPLVSQEVCSQSYPKQITPQMICAGVPRGGKDTCQMDSGGPLYMRKFNGSVALVGIVSWGDGCGRPDKYGVYARVSEAIDWITQITQ